MDTIIYNVEIVDDGRRFHGWVGIEGDKIVAVEEGEPHPELLSGADDTFDGDGSYLFPGMIDEHVHFREPGMTEKADIASESLAAVAGGVTSFIDMPNTVPPTTSTERIREKMEIARRNSLANYGFFIGATKENLDLLPGLDYTKIAGVKLFIGATTGNLVLDDRADLERLFSTVKAVIAVHAEDNALIEKSKLAVVERYGENPPVEAHPDIRSREACLKATRDAVELARKYDARLHVMHVTTADELAEFQPGTICGKRITAETCPQYLLFSREDYSTRGARIKCNPAVKEASDREALRAAVLDGRIDVIATDHAPHLLKDKEGGALKAASGMPSIQFALPLMLDLFPAEIVVEKMANNPARLYGIDRRGFIRPGYYADLVMVEKTEPYEISDYDVKSNCEWTPYDGMTCSHSVVLTFVNGLWTGDSAREVRALKFKN